MSDELDDVFDHVRIFLDRHYPGEELEELRLLLRGGRRLALPAPARRPTATRRLRSSEARHSPGFRTILWYGHRYRLTSKQAGIVEQLWTAQDNGTPDIAQAALLAAIDSDAKRLKDLFRNSPAWGTVVVPGEKPGTFRLGDPQDGLDEDDAP